MKFTIYFVLLFCYFAALMGVTYFGAGLSVALGAQALTIAPWLTTVAEWWAYYAAVMCVLLAAVTAMVVSR